MSPSRLFLIAICCVALFAPGLRSSAAAADSPNPEAACGGDRPSEAPSERSDGDATPKGNTSSGHESSYIRYLEGAPGEGTLQTSIVTMRGSREVQVDLIAAIHVGDAAYYAELDQRFKAYDRLLYEMIKPADVDPTEPRSPNMLSALQIGLRRLLELEFQLDAIDYGAENFVHADLDPTTFFRLQKERGESILTLMLKAMRAEMRSRQKDNSAPLSTFQILMALSRDDSAGAMKCLLGKQMERMESILAGFEDSSPRDEADQESKKSGESEQGSVLVVERNKAALRVLGRELDRGHRKLAIFYGAGHMSDLEERLVNEFGLKRTGLEWVTAWAIRKKDGAAKRRGLFGRPPQTEKRNKSSSAPSGAEPK